ncbi:arylsulfatase [Micromonospora chalcea]|uniref:arylsulfatase n=1 Tax=Micromonospora chalcea TaxID=1874 RepID=UPI0034029BC5
MTSSLADPPYEGTIGRTYHDSTEHWSAPPSAAPGTPNVVYVLLDDVGFADFGCFGAEIDTPTIDRLAASGLRYTNFHTSPLCSPTRASVLTGRNHHSVGMRMLSNFDSGFPSGRGRITHAAATVAEMLADAGFNTMAVGKWHVAPLEHTTPSGPYDQWPLGRGFERYYGFLEAETDNFYPELVHDNHQVDPPATPEEGYHLTEDLTDRAIGFVRDQTSFTPEKPFFLYLAYAAAHAPHQAPPEYLAKYRGRYDAGWDVVRADRHRRQIGLGIIPPDAPLPPHNPGVVPWDDVPPEQRRLFARMQEAYAAMVDHTDAQLGRLVDFLERIGRLDNTIFVLMSDNGASPEGTPLGTLNPTAFQNRVPENLQDSLDRIDEIGGPRAQSNYPLGWAQVSNTPFRRYKQHTHEGGVRVPFVLSWPAGDVPGGQVRTQFQHSIDVTATVLDLVGVQPPAVRRGVPQMPLHGRSFRDGLRDPAAPPSRDRQYFEMFGHRGIYHQGWKAVAFHERGTSWDEDRWELYRIDEDPTESRDLAAEYPEVLRRLIEEFWIEAARYDVLPLDDRGFAVRARVPRPGSVRDRLVFTYLAGVPTVSGAAVPPTMNRSHAITARLRRTDAAQGGVIVALGNVSGGYVLHIKDNRLVYEYNYLGEHHVLRSEGELPLGPVELTFELTKTADCQGVGRLYVDGEAAGAALFPRLLPFFHGFAGMDIGRNIHSPVSPSYPARHEFSGELEYVRFRLAASEEVGEPIAAADDVAPRPSAGVGFEVVD